MKALTIVKRKFLFPITIVGNAVLYGAVADAAVSVREMEQRIDVQELDMSTVRPAEVRIGTAVSQRTDSGEAAPRRLYKNLGTPLNPRAMPGYAGQRHPAGLSDLKMRIPSLRAKVADLQKAASSAADVTDGDELVSPSAFNALGAFPFSASRVNLYGNIVTDEYPYRAIGLIVVRDGEDFLSCTGALVAPSIVLTAAHCISEFGGELYSAAVFFPAYHLDVIPYGAWPVLGVSTPDSWSEGTSVCAGGEGVACDDDIAVLLLESRVDAQGREFTVGEKIGWLGWGLDLYSFDDFFNEPVAQLAQFGYPSTHDAGMTMQRADKGATYDAGFDIVRSSTPFGGGSSGGPNIANFGDPAILSDDFDAGIEAVENVITAVSTAQTRILADSYAAYLTDENFLFPINALCNVEPVACDTDFAAPERTRDIRLSLEEPVDGGVYSGIGNLRGWAAYEFGIVGVEVYIDGEFAFLAPYGGERNDVGNAFPDIPGSSFSGFSLAFGYANLEPGEHEIEVVAVSATGDFLARTSTFTVTKFDTPFIAADDEVSVEEAEASLTGDVVRLEGVVVDGQSYDIELQWTTATQGFDIRSINADSE